MLLTWEAFLRPFGPWRALTQAQASALKLCLPSCDTGGHIPSIPSPLLMTGSFLHSSSLCPLPSILDISMSQRHHPLSVPHCTSPHTGGPTSCPRPCTLHLTALGDSLAHKSEPSLLCFRLFPQRPVTFGKCPNSLTRVTSPAEFGPYRPHKPLLTLYHHSSNPTDSATLVVQDPAPRGLQNLTFLPVCHQQASHSPLFPSLCPELSPGSFLSSQLRYVSSWELPNLPLSPTLG